MANPNCCYHGFSIISCVVLLNLFTAQFVAGADTNPLLGGKKLIIGVPKKSGFTQFLDAQLNSANKSQLVKVSGYSIDVFEAAVNHLQLYSGYNISFEYRPFVNDDGNSAGDYNTLLAQIPKKYDAVVGDVAIVANRSNYVDFTLPYAESGVNMLVKIGHDARLNMWIFVRPFSWDLWLCIFVASIFIGGTIRFMERNVEKDVGLENSPRREQLSRVSVLWLPWAQVVLPERESVAKNCSRFVLVMWLILACVLMQSYTASLSSILTVNQLQPSYPSVTQLRNDPKINVGYPSGSYVRDLLLDPNGLNFAESRLREYSTMEEYREALDEGSLNGGVDAIFDDVPYIKFFLKEYRSNYMMAGPRYRDDGLGFAFPKDSNLTSHFSRAILNVTQSEEMKLIKQKYFGSGEDDEVLGQSNSSPDTTSPSLGANCFAGLFLVIGIPILLALLVSESHVWRRPVKLAKFYSQKLLTLTPTKTSESREGSMTKRIVDEGSSASRDSGLANEFPTRSLSWIDIEKLAV